MSEPTLVELIEAYEHERAEWLRTAGSTEAMTAHRRAMVRAEYALVERLGQAAGRVFHQGTLYGGGGFGPVGMIRGIRTAEEIDREASSVVPSSQETLT